MVPELPLEAVIVVLPQKVPAPLAVTAVGKLYTVPVAATFTVAAPTEATAILPDGVPVAELLSMT